MTTLKEAVSLVSINWEILNHMSKAVVFLLCCVQTMVVLPRSINATGHITRPRFVNFEN